MFADFRPLRKVFGATLSKISFPPVQGKTRLDPEPGRTSRACGIRLSRDQQDNGVQSFVNKKVANFCSGCGAQACSIFGSQLLTRPFEVTISLSRTSIFIAHGLCSYVRAAIPI